MSAPFKPKPFVVRWVVAHLARCRINWAIRWICHEVIREREARP